MVGLSVQHQRELRRPNQPFYRENMQGIAGVLVVEFLYFLKHQLGTEASANVSAGQHKLRLEVRYGKNFAGDYGIFLEKMICFLLQIAAVMAENQGELFQFLGEKRIPLYKERTPALARYAALVTSADQGAILKTPEELS